MQFYNANCGLSTCPSHVIQIREVPSNICAKPSPKLLKPLAACMSLPAEGLGDGWWLNVTLGPFTKTHLSWKKRYVQEAYGQKVALDHLYIKSSTWG